MVQQEHYPTSTVRVAGGWVRDKLLGFHSKDIDIALDNISGVDFAKRVQSTYKDLHQQDQRMYIVKTNPEKSKHLETAALRVFGLDIDFVNLRAEEYTNESSRIPTIETFGTATVDAARRDLTVNALFFNLQKKEVEDFTQCGFNDLHSNLLRTPPGRPSHEVLLEDPLRALRIVRFAVKYGFRIDKDVWEALQQEDVREALKLKVSRERINMELEKMFLCNIGHADAGTGETGGTGGTGGTEGAGGNHVISSNGVGRPLVSVVEPVVILDQLGLHDVIFNRQGCHKHWVQVNDTVTMLRHRFGKIDSNALKPNAITTKSAMFIGIYAAILRSFLSDQCDVKETTTPLPLPLALPSSSSSSSTTTLLDMQRVRQCIQLRDYIMKDQQELYKFVHTIIVDDLACSKKIAKHITVILSGLNVLQTYQTMHNKQEEEGATNTGYFLKDPAWVWTWNCHLEAGIPETVDVISTFIASTKTTDKDEASNKGRINTSILTRTLNDLAGAQSLVATKQGNGNEKNKDVLNGHEIGAAFPILIGPSMKDAVFAHQLWCGVRNMGRGERTGRTTAAVVHEDKVDALEWLRDVYVPLHENGL